MCVDEVITLANNKNYLLLLESEETDERYFLAVLLDEEDNATNNYAVVKEVIQDGKIYCKLENNLEILNTLLSDFQSQYEDEYAN